ncbi:MAG: L,D-transpeptidase, partial [Pseudomonadota bacterium]
FGASRRGMSMITRRGLLAGVSAACLLGGGNARAQSGTVPVPRQAPASATIDTEGLAPGGFIWQPELSPEGPVVIIVSLTEQLVHVYRNGVEIGVSTCSTGKPGHRTPTGVFVILQKDRDHHSSLYNDAPMPNMQRLTWGGVALHAGHLPGYPASHGCVRLPRAFSAELFAVTHLGVPVVVADETSDPASVVHPGFLLPAEAEAEANAALVAAASKAHHPSDATVGTHDVVSIVISGADRTAMMFMDGVEIWRSPVRIKDPSRPLGNHIYKLMGAAKDGSGFEWLAHGIHTVAAGGSDAADVLNRIEIEEWASAVEILADLRPGSTLVVTDLAASPDTRSGPDFVILRDS